MSGIGGIVSFTGSRVEPSQMVPMVEALRHRGPDGQDVWSCENAGLTCLMLKTTNEASEEKLPFYDSECQLAVTADARLDNRLELKENLSLGRGQAAADSEILLEAYKKWGGDCCRHLLGDFAFAVWDKKQQRLFLCRDHIGVRPLYYYHSDGLFAFASEIRGLLALPDVPLRINEERVADYVAIQDDYTSTFYKNIYILPPAHTLVVSGSGMRTSQYWQLEPGPLLKLRGNDEYTDAFREVFYKSVKCRLRGIDPIGSYLSGGLDSSSVTVAARDLLAEGGRQPPHTFSFYFDHLRSCDERQYFQQVIDQGNVIPHLVQADDCPTREEYDRLQSTFEGAVSAFNTYPPWKIVRKAAREGVKILLSGFDGDTTVSHGTGLFIELARSLRWGRLYQECRGYGGHFKLTTWEILSYYLKNYSILSNAYILKKRIARYIRGAAGQPLRGDEMLPPPTFLNEDFAHRIDAAARFRNQRKKINKKEFNEQLWHLQRLTAASLSRNLGIANGCSSFFGIEERYPFFDIRLMEFCLSLPASQKLDRGWNRVIMRRAMETELPPEVCWRGGKGDLGPHADNLAKLLIGMYALQGQPDTSKIFDYLDSEKVRSALRTALENDTKFSGSERLCRIIALMIWMQKMERSFQVGRTA